MDPSLLMSLLNCAHLRSASSRAMPRPLLQLPPQPRCKLSCKRAQTCQRLYCTFRMRPAWRACASAIRVGRRAGWQWSAATWASRLVCGSPGMQCRTSVCISSRQARTPPLRLIPPTGTSGSFPQPSHSRIEWRLQARRTAGRKGRPGARRTGSVIVCLFVCACAQRYIFVVPDSNTATSDDSGMLFQRLTRQLRPFSLASF